MAGAGADHRHDIDAIIDAILARFRDVEGATLPILHAVQNSIGYIPASAVPTIAAFLNRTRAEIHGVISFYHDFRHEPPGRHIVRLCRSEACQSMGAEAVADVFRQDLGMEIGEQTADGRVSLEPVYCLGLCACAPAAMIDGRVIGRLSADAARRIVRELE